MSNQDLQHSQNLAIEIDPQTWANIVEDRYLGPKIIGGALAAGALLSGAIALTDVQPAYAAEIQPAPVVKTVPVKPGGSAWSTMAENTTMTPAEIADAVPAFNTLNGPVINPNQQVQLPEAIDHTHTIRTGEVVWNLIEQQYGRVNPEMVAAVAAANNLPNFDEYYGGQRIVLPRSLANHVQAPSVAPATLTPNQLPIVPKTEMPAVTPDTAIWKAKPGPQVLTIIDVVSKIEGVPPAKVAAWIRDANTGIDLAKLTEDQPLKIPGMTQQKWDELWNNVNKLALFSQWVQAAAKNAEIPVSPNVIIPSNVVKLQKNYVRMPDAPNGEYRFTNPNPDVHSGSEALIQTSYTAGIKWKELHPESPLVFEDFNAAEGHASHDKGIDVDVVTADNSAATIHGSQARNIELAKMFFDTGQVEGIFFNDPMV